MVRPSVKVYEGQELHTRVPASAQVMQRPTPDCPRPINVLFNGTNGENTPDRFFLTEKLLSQHLMLIGGIGSGKTNTFNQILQTIVPQLSSKDVMIIFDTKGDFYKEFYRPGDIVISNDSTARGSTGVDYWNLISEIDGTIGIKEDVIEIANGLFADKLKTAGDNSFFPQAAKDIMSALLYHFVMLRNKGILKCDNNIISESMKKEDLDWYRKILLTYPNYAAMQSYIPKDAMEQALGVLAELQQVVRALFVGNFAKKGELSIRKLVRNKGGKKIFIEYDIGLGSMLTPIYSLLFDLAIKEALCRSKSDGNVFFVCDEFKLLPNLKHIDDAVNFGRSLGIKFMIGVQNVDQIIETYGENRAMNIFSGFLNVFAFKVGDYTSRNYIKERLGENRKCTVYKSSTVQESIATAHVVEDWDIASLNTGEAIVSINSSEPFKFRFSQFAGRR